MFLALLGALMVGYSALLDHAGVSRGSLFALIGALGAKGVLDFFTLAKYRVLITADQRAWVIAAASGVATLLSVAIIAAVALSGGSVVLAHAAAVLPLALRSIALRIYTDRRYPEVDYTAPAEKSALAQRWDALYLQVLGSVQLGAPVILATVLLGDLRQVSVLSIYMLITSGIQLIIGVPANSLQASFGDVIARGETATLHRAYRELEFIVHSTAAVVCGTAFVTMSSFIAVYTADFADARYVYPLLGFLAVLDVLLYHMKTPQGLMVISAGLYRATRWQTTIQGLIIVVGGIPLGLAWGLKGIVAAACLSDLYRTVDLLYFVPKHVTGLPVGESMRRILLTLVSVSIICIPFVWVHFDAASLGGWLLKAFGVTVWSTFVVSALGFFFARPQMLGSLARLGAVFETRGHPGCRADEVL